MKRPSFQFYPADWLSDFKVQAMTAEQRGAYIQLLCYMWLEDSCSLPSDMEQLSAITKCPIEPLRTVVQHFVENGSSITHKRLLAERKKQNDWREKSKRAGIASGKSRKHKPKIAIEPTFNQTPNQTRTKREPNMNSSSSSSSSSLYKEKENIIKEKESLFLPPQPMSSPSAAVHSQEFEKFWNLYPKKIAKRKALSSFKQISETELPALFLGLDAYKKNWNDPQFIPYPSTWLNQERWKDDLQIVSPRKIIDPIEVEGKIYDRTLVLEWRKQGKLKIGLDGCEHFIN